MKNLSYFFLCAIFIINTADSLNAQTEVIKNLKSQIIEIQSDYLDVKIETWKENHIKIESAIEINLKDGIDKHDLQIQNNADGIVIKSIVDTENIEQMVITTDFEGNKEYTPAANWNQLKDKSHFKDVNIGYDLEGAVTLYVPENVLIQIKTTYGDAFIDGAYQQIEVCSTYGLIEAKLAEVSNMRKVSLTSTYHIVDLTLNQDSDATLKLNTTYGSVFTDLPLQTKQSNEKKSNHSCSQSSERYVLNNGNTNIDIVATYDNIYVRSF